MGGVATRPRDLLTHGPPGPLEGVHRDARREERGADDPALAGALTVQERRQDARGSVHSRQQVADREAHLLRSAMLGLLAELDHDAAESLRTVIFRWGADLVEPLVTRAQSRGELGPTEVPTPILALPLDLARHELAMRGDLPTDRIETIVGTIVVPLMDLHSHASA